MSTHQGRLTESIFRTESLKRNFKIYAPVSDDHGVDFIIFNGKDYLRIQVKSTSKPDLRYPSKPTYRFCVRKGAESKAYSGEEFDYVACYIMDINLWYIIPMHKVQNKSTIRINPKSEKCSFYQYRDNFKALN